MHSKCCVNTTQSADSNVIAIKISMAFFAEIEKPILKFKWNLKRIAKTTLKKNKIGRLTPLNFKTYYKGVVIKTIWYCHRTDV